jgi:hypothetical protein
MDSNYFDEEEATDAEVASLAVTFLCAVGVMCLVVWYLVFW